MTDIIVLFLSLSVVLFGIGMYGIISKRTMLRMLLASEINFNAAVLALVAFGSQAPAIGEVVALLATGIAAADVGVLVAIAILMYRIKKHADVYELRNQEEN
jgi:NADH:ubiquinone oxidoreductase subunit K